MVLLYHTCYQNLPPVHKADIEFFAASFHPSSKEVLKQSEHVVLYQEKQNLLGLAVVSPTINNVVDLTLIGVAHPKQKQKRGTLHEGHGREIAHADPGALITVFVMCISDSRHFASARLARNEERLQTRSTYLMHARAC